MTTGEQGAPTARGARWFFASVGAQPGYRWGAAFVVLLALPLAIANGYQQYLLDLIMINVVLAVGLNIVKGFAGQVNVGHVALAALKAESLKLKQGGATFLLRDRNDKLVDLTVAFDGADGKRWLDTKQRVPVGDWGVWVHNIKDDGYIVALTCK